MSISTDLANAVASDIKSEFGSDCSVSLALVPRSDLKDSHNKTIVMVCPKKIAITEDARAIGAVYRVAIDIGIIRQCSTRNDDIAGLTDLVERILMFLRKRRISGYQSAKCVAISNDPIYDVGRILNESLFFSIVSVEYLLRAGG